jgi:hypothetical protein
LVILAFDLIEIDIISACPHDFKGLRHELSFRSLSIRAFSIDRCIGSVQGAHGFVNANFL